MIQSCTFQYCSKLERVSIPNTVKRIEGHAFKECKALRGIAIPDSVSSINLFAFWGCPNLDRLVFPAAVKDISGYRGSVTEKTLKAAGIRYSYLEDENA